MSFSSAYRRLRGTHPGLVLAALDLLGLVVAAYLSSVELQNEDPVCLVISGCDTVAHSEYSRIGGIPVAVFGVGLSLVLLTLALAWWRRGGIPLLAGHYFLSLVGVIFEARFMFLQAFVIKAICIWCLTYGISLILRFVLAFWVWMRRDRYQGVVA